jgi:hypothetical protein
MLTAMIQSLIAPRYPRRYVGRHRARFTTRSVVIALTPRREE